MFVPGKFLGRQKNLYPDHKLLKFPGFFNSFVGGFKELDNLIKYYYCRTQSNLKDTHDMIKKLYMVLFVDIHALNLLNIDYIRYLIQKNIN